MTRFIFSGLLLASLKGIFTLRSTIPIRHGLRSHPSSTLLYAATETPPSEIELSAFSSSISNPNPNPNLGNGGIMTLSRFMIEATRSNPDHADFEGLVSSIQIACKTIAILVARHGVNDLMGSSTKDERSLFNLASTALKNSLRFTGKLGVYTPHDDLESPLLIEEAWNSNYVTVFDPLDGAGNVDVGVVSGTIFGIFKEKEECLVDFGETVSEQAEKRLLKALQGPNLVAAGYCMYSSSTVMMFSMGDGLHGFTLDPAIGEFVLTHRNVKIPNRGQIYSFNEANQFKWPKGLQDYVTNIKTGKGETNKTYTARYIGSQVGDLHRTLLYGGMVNHT